MFNSLADRVKTVNKILLLKWWQVVDLTAQGRMPKTQPHVSQRKRRPSVVTTSPHAAVAAVRSN